MQVSSRRTCRIWTNLEGLLPADKVKDFKGTADEVSFKIQGGIEIRLTRTTEAFEGDSLRLQGGGAPFTFHLDLKVVEASMEPEHR